MNMDRHDKLEQSFDSGQAPYQFYSVMRTRTLRKLGNPFFGGEGEPSEWDFDRKMGVAWVIFTRTTEQVEALLAKPDALAAIDKIWQEEMHWREQERIYRWVMEQAGLTEIAKTEAVPEKGGKSEQPEAAGTPPVG